MKFDHIQLPQLRMRGAATRLAILAVVLLSVLLVSQAFAPRANAQTIISIEFDKSHYNVREGATFYSTLKLTPKPYGSAYFNVVLKPVTATAGSDFPDRHWGFYTYNSETIGISIPLDNEIEGPETFTLNIVDMSIIGDSQVLVADDPATVQIVDINEVPGDWPLIPHDVGAGEQFRLVFQTRKQRDQTSSDIADYDTFVRNEAQDGHAAIVPYADTFQVVGSTATVDARVHTATGDIESRKGGPKTPIYWLDGDRIADNHADFWDGSWNAQLPADARLQTGVRALNVWPATGTQTGTTIETAGVASGRPLGHESQVTIGAWGEDANPISHVHWPSVNTKRPLLAISQIFRVEDTAVTYVPADWDLIPTGFKPGDRFRLIFATAGFHLNALKTDIAHYNNLVQSAASAGHEAVQPYKDGFRVLGSTDVIHARNNTATTGKGVPIYWLGGKKVANNYTDLYDGSWSNIGSDKDEKGENSQRLNVWTGSDWDGSRHESAYLGASEGVVYGQLINGPPINRGTIPGTNVGRLYGMSPVFEIETPTLTVPRDWELLPSGLRPGDRFRLIFATSIGYLHQSGNIDTYNNRVQKAAANGLAAIQPYSDHFYALASTASIDARDNTLTAASARQVPIYWLTGKKVADSYADFYDGSWDSLESKSETGQPIRDKDARYIATGSHSDGVKWQERWHHRWLGGSHLVQVGQVDYMFHQDNYTGWSTNPIDSNPINSNRYLSLYGLSMVFKVSSETTSQTTN